MKIKSLFLLVIFLVSSHTKADQNLAPIIACGLGIGTFLYDRYSFNKALVQERKNKIDQAYNLLDPKIRENAESILLRPNSLVKLQFTNMNQNNEFITESAFCNSTNEAFDYCLEWRLFDVQAAIFGDKKLSKDELIVLRKLLKDYIFEGKRPPVKDMPTFIKEKAYKYFSKL